MSAGKLLLLLTNYYPFYKGEEYIENEIAIAAERFEKVLIVPTMATKEMLPTRKVPENVEIIKLDLDYSLPGRVKMVLRGLKNTGGAKAKTAAGKKLGPKQRAYSLYFAARAEYVFSEITKNSAFNTVTAQYDPKDIAIYSYWLHITASVAVRLKERVFHHQCVCISRGHRYDLYDYAAPCNYIPDREYMLKHIDAVYPCSEDGVRYLNQHYGEFADKITVGRLGTLEREKVTCEREPVFSIVSCSAVREVKRLDKIIDTVAYLNSKGYAIRWTHLGDGPYLDEVKKYAEKNLPEKLYRFAGRLANKDLFGWYASNPVSCFMNLSDSEGVPVAIMEVMSCGIPTIATDVGGTKEIVLNGVNGYVVQTTDPVEKIAASVIEMMELPEQAYQNMCREAIRIWNERSNAKELYRDFYEQLTALMSQNARAK